MGYVWTAVGCGVLLLIMIDAFLTILGGQTAGPVTRAWSGGLWQGMLAVHERRSAHRVLALAGPVTVLGTIIIWYSGLVLGAWLIFASHSGSVVSSSTRVPADAAQILYFVPVTISGLGYGDFVPSGWPWTLLSTTSSIIGAIILTSSLSYIISVVGAAIRRRTYASSVFGLGSEPAVVIPRLRLGDARESMHNYLSTLASSLTDVAEQELTYPVLRYFHAARRHSSPAAATLLLADTLYLVSHLPQGERVAPGTAALIDSSITTFIDVKRLRDTSDDDSQFEVIRQQADALGLPTNAESAVMSGLAEHLERRNLLLAACRHDGWGSPDYPISSSHSRPRGSARS